MSESRNEYASQLSDALAKITKLPALWTIEEQNFASSLADFMALAMESAERHRARIGAGKYDILSMINDIVTPGAMV